MTICKKKTSVDHFPRREVAEHPHSVILMTMRFICLPCRPIMNRSTLLLIGLLTSLIWPLTTRANTANSTPAAIASGTQATPVHPEASVPHSKSRPATIASSAPLHHSRKDTPIESAQETINAGRYEKIDPQQPPAPVRLELRDAH